MRFPLSIYFCFISSILSENYYDDQYENQSEGSFYADWELMEVASSPQGNHNETISLSSETDKSSSETCVVAKIMNSVWTHLTGLADEIERLEKELHWDNSNETINKQLNETDDYPDASNNSQELDLTEVKSSGASSINMSRPFEKVGILTPNSSSVDITANRTCNDGTCSNAMVIKNGEMKVNGTSVKQLANKMEIEKLEQWQNQIENCKQLLKLDPNITLEEITSKYRRKKYKDRAIPVDERSFYRRHSEAGKLHRPRHFRGKRQAHLAPSLREYLKKLTYHIQISHAFLQNLKQN